MSSHEAMSLQLKPIISYPREAQVGKIYLMSIDVQFNPRKTAWNFPEEEYTIGFILNANPYFTWKPLHGEGWPEVMLHRFGGTYGPAEILLTAADHAIGPGHITITLVNGWGIPMATQELPCEVKQESEAREGQKEITIAARQEAPTRIDMQLEEPPLTLVSDEEQEERERIDRIADMLTEANWLVADESDTTTAFSAGAIAVKSYPPLDELNIGFLLLLDGEAVGIVMQEGADGLLETMNEVLSISSLQSSEISAARDPLPFIYEMQGEEILFRNNLEPDARSRVVFHFHRPETLAHWLQQAPVGTPNELNDLLRARLRRMPSVSNSYLQDDQIAAITNLEHSLAQNRLRALLQMAINTRTIMYSIYRLLRFGGAERILCLMDSESDVSDILVAFLRSVIPGTETDFKDVYNITTYIGIGAASYNPLDPSQNVYIMSIGQLYHVLSDHSEDTTSAEGAITYHAELPIGFFDIIFFVECLDRLPRQYRPLLDYFDAFLVGVGTDIPPQVMGLFNRTVVYKERRKVSIFYSHRDQEYLDRLQVHLAAYEHEELTIDVFDIQYNKKDFPKIISQKEAEIRKALDTTRVAILLTSADFLDSELITTTAGNVFPHASLLPELLLQKKKITPNHSLRQARKKRIWTLEDVAERIEVSSATVARWEQGKSSPRSRNLQKLCQLFNESLEELGFATKETIAPSTADEITIIPVIVSPCLFKETPLAEFESFNDPSKPLSTQTISDREKVWADLARYVDDLVTKGS
jgi:transcriptional regulator with XRE-family HTH domain